jgi:TolA-binding protein
LAKLAQQEEPQAGALPRLSSRVAARLGQARAWAAQRPWRSAAIGGGIVAMIAAVLVGWVYLSSMAVLELSVDLDQALQAWDERDLDKAEQLARALQRRSDFEDLIGGALFVMGAVKAQEAEQQTSSARRQLDYLIASRYLEEARSYGFPPDRDGEGLYWLGRTLVASHQLPHAIEVLNEALEITTSFATDIHRLLGRACLTLPDPRLDDALRNITAALEDATLPANEQADALLLKTKILIAQQQYDTAQATLESVPRDINTGAWCELLHGQILLQRAGLAPRETAQDPLEADPQSAQSIDQARQHLQAARSQDRAVGAVTRQAIFWLGRASQLQGDVPEALRQFVALRKSFASTPEGIAASLMEGELRQGQEEHDPALLAYRRVLESVDDPGVYHNPLLTLSELQRRIQAAVTRYIDKQQFEQALVLLELYPPLFERDAQSEQQAIAYAQWGSMLEGQAVAAPIKKTADQLRKASRLRYRQAGAAYEQLATLRFATRRHPDDLWEAAQCYYTGQSYSSAARVLEQYLQHEPEHRNPQALLRLSQSQLALGNVASSIHALEECIEFHPRDEAVYQARVDLSHCYRLQGDVARSEELLLDNLTRSRLTPRSPEWRDSLFEMGSLLHDVGRYGEAIDYLQRYLLRVRQSREQFQDSALDSSEEEFQELSASYLIADSHRLAAADPLEKMAVARSQGERDKIRKSVSDELGKSEEKFKEVVVKITTRSDGYRGDPLLESMLRNSYMMLGSVLFDQGKYKEASEVYSNVSSLYQHSPFVLETYVQIAHCWRRMNQPDRARGMIESAQFVLNQLPVDADYLNTTTFSREEWQTLINDMATW